MGKSLTRRRRRVGRQALVGTLIDAIYEYEYENLPHDADADLNRAPH